jgi:hypothetical protein
MHSDTARPPQVAVSTQLGTLAARWCGPGPCPLEAIRGRVSFIEATTTGATLWHRAPRMAQAITAHIIIAPIAEAAALPEVPLPGTQARSSMNMSSHYGGVSRHPLPKPRHPLPKPREATPTVGLEPCAVLPEATTCDAPLEVVHYAAGRSTEGSRSPCRGNITPDSYLEDIHEVGWLR